MLILKNKKEHKDTSIKNGMMLQSFQKKRTNIWGMLFLVKFYINLIPFIPFLKILFLFFYENKAETSWNSENFAEHSDWLKFNKLRTY